MNKEFLNFFIKNSRKKASFWLKWVKQLLMVQSTVDSQQDYELER